MNRTEFRIGQKKKKLQIWKLCLVSLAKEKRRKIMKEKLKVLAAAFHSFWYLLFFLHRTSSSGTHCITLTNLEDAGDVT